jgi:hypothetical protein
MRPSVAAAQPDDCDAISRYAHGGCAPQLDEQLLSEVGGQAAVVAVLEELPGICSLAVAAGSMIMIGIMFYKDWLQ